MDKLTDEQKKAILYYHTELKMRPYKIACAMDKKVGIDSIKTIIKNYKIGEYSNRKLKDVLYNDVLNAYQKSDFIDKDNRIDLTTIMPFFPELTFGEIKTIIDDFYKLLNIAKPYRIKFPEKLVRDFEETHSIEETCLEFGYEKPEMIRRLSGKKNINEMTKKELMDYKMQILEKDVNSMGEKKFNNKYGNQLSRKTAKRLILEYKSKQK